MNWPSPGIWSAIAAVGLLFLAGWQQFRVVRKQNAKQLAKQRRIERDLFGEDPDNPGGPKGQSLRDMVGTVMANTQTLPDRMASAESRLGKVEDRQNLLDSRLTDAEHALHRSGGGS